MCLEQTRHEVRQQRQQWKRAGEYSERDESRKQGGLTVAFAVRLHGQSSSTITTDDFFTQKKFGHDFLYKIAFSIRRNKVALK